MEANEMKSGATCPTDQIKADMVAKLRQLGLPFEKLTVFGRIRCNVHVVCEGRDTAQRWAQALSAVFSGTKVGCVPHRWNASENKGTCLRPTMRKGYLVTVAA